MVCNLNTHTHTQREKHTRYWQGQICLEFLKCWCLTRSPESPKLWKERHLAPGERVFFGVGWICHSRTPTNSLWDSLAVYPHQQGLRPSFLTAEASSGCKEGISLVPSMIQEQTPKQKQERKNVEWVTGQGVQPGFPKQLLESVSFGHKIVTCVTSPAFTFHLCGERSQDQMRRCKAIKVFLGFCFNYIKGNQLAFPHPLWKCYSLPPWTTFIQPGLQKNLLLPSVLWVWVRGQPKRWVKAIA